MLSIRADSMILADERIKDSSEVLVGIPISSIDSAMLVVEFDCAGNGFS